MTEHDRGAPRVGPQPVLVGDRVRLRPFQEADLDAAGQMLCAEATRLVLEHAFATIGLHRVELEVYDHNPRALHVYRRVGFRVEGVRREALRWEGRYHDAIIMGLLASEWRAAADARDAGATSGG